MAAAGRKGLTACGRWTLATASRSVRVRNAAQIMSRRMYAAWEESVEVDQDVSPTRQIRQALKEVRLQKAAPAWLPLMPGSSFWVPPEEYEEESDDEDENDTESLVIMWPETNFKPSNNAEFYSLISPMGWPATELMAGEDDAEAHSSDEDGDSEDDD